MKTLVASPFYNGARRSAFALIRMAIEQARRFPREKEVNEEATEAASTGTAEAESPEDTAERLRNQLAQYRTLVEADYEAGRISWSFADTCYGVANAIEDLINEVEGAVTEAQRRRQREVFTVLNSSYPDEEAEAATEDHDGSDPSHPEGVEVEGQGVAEQEERGAPDRDSTGDAGGHA